MRVGPREGVDLVLLGGVCLHDLDAREVLLHAAREVAEPLLDAEGPLHEQPARPLHDEEGGGVDRE